MSYLGQCTRKDLLRRLADPMALLIWIGIPLVLGGLITLISSDGAPPRVRVLLVDQDESFVSELLVGAFQRGGDASPLDGSVVTLEDGLRRMGKGEASALVVIPAGFGAALLREPTAEPPLILRLVTNPSQRILPGIVEETLRAGVDLAFYAQRLLGPQIAEIRAQMEAEREPTQLDVMRIAAEVHAAIQSVSDVLLPPVLELEVAPLSEPDATEEAKPPQPTSMALFMFPGMLLMSLLFVAQGSSPDLWSERSMGTLRRAATAPGSLAAFLGGKLAAVTILMGAIALLGAALMVLFFGQDPARALWGVLWATACALAFAVLMFWLQTLAGSERGGGLITMLILFPLLMVGGTFFPFEAMPEGLAAIGRLTPAGLAVNGLARILDGSAKLAELARAAAWLGVPAALLFLSLSARLRSTFVAGGRG
jgi:ABC-type transport system involved in cytochrome c biogenesis permease component